MECFSFQFSACSFAFVSYSLFQFLFWYLIFKNHFQKLSCWWDWSWQCNRSWFLWLDHISGDARPWQRMSTIISWETWGSAVRRCLVYECLSVQPCRDLKEEGCSSIWNLVRFCHSKYGQNSPRVPCQRHDCCSPHFPQGAEDHVWRCSVFQQQKGKSELGESSCTEEWELLRSILFHLLLLLVCVRACAWKPLGRLALSPFWTLECGCQGGSQVAFYSGADLNPAVDFHTGLLDY